MTSRDHQDWRGGRAPRNSPRSEKMVPSWKRSRSTADASVSTGSGTWKRRFRILLASLCLFALVALMIYVWRRAERLTTHFVLLNLRQESVDFDDATGFHLPEKLVGEKTDTSKRRITLCSMDSLSLSKADDTESRAQLDKAQVVVIYLQTTFVPALNGQFRCLLRNSTPNLNANKYADLQDLKNEIEAAAAKEKGSNKRWLLLIDQIPAELEWRTGFLQSDVNKEFERWVGDIPGLVVVLSSALSDHSEPGIPGTSGQSIFSHFVSLGLSKLADVAQGADEKPDGDLETDEFCHYVSDRTNEWVRNHRNPAGQSVRVFPKDTNRKFVIMRDAVESAATAAEISLTGKQDQELTEQISTQWKLRDSLAAKGGVLWSPLVWRAATEELKRAERALLHGSEASAENSVAEARKHVSDLKTELEQMCPNEGDFQPERGIFFHRFSELPSASRVKPPSSTTSPDTITPNTPPLAEDVVASHLKSFTDISGVTSSDINSIRTRRKKAEESFAQVFNCSHRLQHTIRHLENSLLLAEDRRFTSTPADPAEEQRIDNMLDAVAEFAKTHDAAETTLRNTFECLPELAYWAAHCDCGDLIEDQGTWRDVLATNSADADHKPGEIPGLCANLSAATPHNSTAPHDLSRKLRKEVFQLCAYAKGLRKTLENQEPESGLDVAKLKADTDELNAWNAAASASFTSTGKAAEKLCEEAVKQEAATRIEQVRIYQFLRSALNLTCVSAEKHIEVLRRLQHWNGTWSKPQNGQTAADQPNAIPWQTPLDLEALWLLQVLNLMPLSEAQSSGLKHIQGLLGDLASEDPQQKHNSLAEFGDAVRKIWIDNQKNVSAAVTSTSDNEFALLRDADVQARLYSGFDAKVEIEHSPVERLRQQTKLKYCVIQADRLLTGLWVEPDEQNRLPMSKNGWFARSANAWLDAAVACSKELPAAKQDPPPEIAALRLRLVSSDTLALVGNSPISLIDLGDEFREDESLDISITETIPDLVSGEASLLIKLDVDTEAGGALEIKKNASPIVVGQAKAQATLNIQRRGHPTDGEGCDPFELTPQIFFRGRLWRSAETVSVSTCAPREYVTTISARPKTASITVKGFAPRPVILILDLSFSMDDPLSNDPMTKRYHAAIETLKNLIDGTELQGTEVTLKVYGHRVKYNKETGRYSFNDNYISAFPTRRIDPNMNSYNDIENIFRQTMPIPDQTGIVQIPNQKQVLLDVLESLRKSGPFGSTPLFESIRRAIEFDLKKNSGIIIAITDGAPTDDGDPDNEEDKTIELHRALEKNSDASVYVVAFDLAGNATESARLKATFDKFGGRISIVDASDEKGLREEIQQSLDPRKFNVSWPDEPQGRDAPLGDSVENLPIGNNFRVQFGNDISLEKVPLNYDDALHLNLSLKEKRFRVDRPTSSSQKMAEPASSGDDRPWILKSIDGAQMFDIPGEDATQFGKAVLHLMLDHEDDGRVVRQPAEIEFYIRTQDSPGRPAGLSQKFDSSRGAPAWEITIDKWHKGKNFLVDAFWKMERSVPARFINWETLKVHDSLATAIRLDEDSNGLPPCKVWTTLRDQELQVRIDPVPGEPYPDPDPSPPAEIRVELGQTDTLEQAATFRPWEIPTTVIRTERGSVIYKFSGDQINPENLKRANIAYTSAANRHEGATEVKDFKIDY